MTHILIFENTIEEAQNIATNLQKLDGVIVFTSSSYEDSFNILKEFNIDIVFVNNHQFKKNDYALINTLQNFVYFSNIKIFLMTDDKTEESDIENAYEMGIYDDFTKPLNFKIIENKIRNLKICINEYFLDKKIDAILNSQSSIILITDGTKILNISKQFFKDFDYKDLVDFSTKHFCICDLFLEKNKEIKHLRKNMNGSTWIEYLMKNQNELIDVYLLDKNANEKIYSVKFVDKIKLSSTRKEYIIVFDDVTKIREMTKINEKSQFDFVEQANSMFKLQHRLEQSLKKEKAEKESKEMFFANMSHEIRTPLNGIVGSLDLLFETPLNSKQKKYLDMCKNSSTHLLGIVDDILDINKISSDKFELNFEPCSIKNELKEIKSLFNNDFINKDIELKFQIDNHIPDYVDLDVKRFKQIFINLISNSYKFTNTGFVSVIVKVLEKNINSSKIYFEVKDTGIGILKENISKIFEPYFQEDRTTFTKFGGTGLGTVIIKNLIEAFGSKVNILSEQNLGTSIFFELDLDISKDYIKSKVENYKEFKFNNENILIAEDNITNQTLIKALLKSINLNPTVKNNGIEAYKEYCNNPSKYSLILMDINMPELDGMESSIKIREYERKNIITNIPIIALSANAMTGDKQKYISCGMNECLSKPVDKKKLNIVLKNYLNCELSNNIKNEDSQNDLNNDIPIEELSKHFGVDKSTIIEIINDFFNDFTKQFDLLLIANKDKKNNEIKAILHTMKGATAELKLSLLNDEIKKLEYKVENDLEVNTEHLSFLKNDLALKLDLLR